MKKLLLLGLVLTLILPLQAQEEQKTFIIKERLLTPKPEKMVEFRKNLAEHNKKFYSEAEKQVVVFEVITGENTGKYYMFNNPSSWEGIDEIHTNKEAQEHWNSMVVPTLEKNPEAVFWSVDTELSHTDPNIIPNYYRYVTWKFKEEEGVYKQFTSFIKKINEMREKFDIDNSRGYYWKRYGSNDDARFVMAHFAESFQDFNKGNPDFEKQFEEVHGEGSLEEFDNGILKKITEVTQEIRKLDTELSTRSFSKTVAESN